jgi:hypothetical protein
VFGDLLFARFSRARFALFFALKRSFLAFFASEDDSKDLGAVSARNALSAGTPSNACLKSCPGRVDSVFGGPERIEVAEAIQQVF